MVMHEHTTAYSVNKSSTFNPFLHLTFFFVHLKNVEPIKHN